MGTTQGELAIDWQKDVRYPVVYRVGTGWQITACVVGLLFGAGGAFLLWLATQHSNAAGVAPVLGVTGLFVFALMAWFIGYAINGRITLERDAIEIRKAFSTRRLQRSEIVGRRMIKGRNASYPAIVPTSGWPVRIDRSSFKLDDRFGAWFNSLPDLDAKAREESLAQIEKDTSLGSNPQERRAALEKAKKLAAVLTFVPMGLLFWVMVYPQPYELAIACVAFAPWLGVLLVWSKPGLFQFDGKPGDVRPNVAMLLITPSLALMLRALRDVAVVDIRQLLIWGVVAGLPLWAAVLAAPKPQVSATTKPNRAWVWMLLPFAMAYGGGLLALTDRMWDTAPAQVFQTSVIGKHVTRGKSTTYYLDLAPWNTQIDKNNIAVPGNVYASIGTGATVCVQLHPGRFGLRWMALARCDV